MKITTTQEINEDRIKLQKDITGLLEKFEENHGKIIDDIFIRRWLKKGENNIISVNLKLSFKY